MVKDANVEKQQGEQQKEAMREEERRGIAGR